MEVEAEGSSHAPMEEEADAFRRSKRWNKEGTGEDMDRGKKDEEQCGKGSERVSYRDSVIGKGRSDHVYGSGLEEEEEVSYDDEIEEGTNGSWFSMGMTHKEKIEARRPWWNSLIIKLVGRPIGYHYLWQRLQSMWRTQSEPLLIDLGNAYFIVKLGGRADYERALTEGPWLIGDNCLHVQRWKPTFVAESAKITTLPVWVCFPKLPVE